ncbi:DUF2178 domain-containing protein [Halosegnis longus]|uniref:DUF2178 domain-containing protein n=1 Tax=Halosegnis longus TaxID=2216012 RepID=UPI00096A7B9B|nr:DUF2178 domain-containing protein [Salella cibi]
MTTSQTTPRLSRTTYQRVVYGIIALAVIGLFVGIIVDRPLAGTAVYLVGAWVGGGFAFLAPRLSSAQLQDERDDALHNRASGLLLKIVTVITLATVPALYVLDAADYLTIPGALWGAIVTLSALFILYGVCYGLVKQRG